MDLRSARWGILSRDGALFPFAWLDEDRAVVFRGTRKPEVWYLADLLKHGEVERADPLPGLNGPALTAACTGFPVADFPNLEAFCAEPRTAEEIEETFDRADVPLLESAGVLRAAGGRWSWAGYDLDALLTRLSFETAQAIRRHDRIK